jgi:hypothetical protein
MDHVPLKLATIAILATNVTNQEAAYAFLGSSVIMIPIAKKKMTFACLVVKKTMSKNCK